MQKSMVNPNMQTPIKDFFQPNIVTIAQLKANRSAQQQFNKEWMLNQPRSETGFEEYQPSNLLQCDWSEYGVNPNVTESMQSYIDTLMFRSVWEQDLHIGNTVVLFHKFKFANPLTDKDLLNRSHGGRHQRGQEVPLVR
jgi:hypothetical protein